MIILPAHPQSRTKLKAIAALSKEHRGHKGRRGDQHIHHHSIVGRQILKQGQILVELKPVYYEITSFTNGQLRDVSSGDVDLERIIYLTADQFGK